MNKQGFIFSFVLIVLFCNIIIRESSDLLINLGFITLLKENAQVDPNGICLQKSSWGIGGQCLNQQLDFHSCPDSQPNTANSKRIFLLAHKLFSSNVQRPLAINSVREQDINAAVDLLDTTWSDSTAFALFAKGNLQVFLGDNDSGYATLRQVKNAEILFANLGYHAANSKDYEAAISCLESSISIELSPLALYHLGNIYQNTHQYERAIAIYEQLVDFDETPVRINAATQRPSNFFALKGMGQVAAHQRNWPLAIKHFENALLQYPNDAVVHTQIAWPIYQHSQDADLALEHLVIAADLDKSSAWPFLILGDIYTAEAIYSEAKEAYYHALQINSFQGNGYYRLAKVYQQQGLHDEAIRVLEIGLVKDPHNAVYRKEVCTYYKEEQPCQ